MHNRETGLKNLAVGDIFHARSPNGANMICLVTGTDDSTIHARRIHTQDDLLFDRRTGVKSTGVPSRIDCVAPFPPETQQIFREMDKKYGTLKELHQAGAELDSQQSRLTPDESRANRSIKAHVVANPI
jgi:hypothetical protein